MPKSPKYLNSLGEEIDLTVKVFTRPNLRGYNEEMLAYVGITSLKNIFDELIIDDKKQELCFVYPERWTNIIEQRALLTRIQLIYPAIKTVDITTHSVYIVQCTNREYIRIYDDPGYYPEEFGGYENINVRYSPNPSVSEGLMVLKG